MNDTDAKLMWVALDAAGVRIKQLEAALRPFAEYGEYMKDRWTQRDGNAFYGVKRIDAPQIRIGDFRQAARVLCSSSKSTTRES